MFIITGDTHGDFERYAHQIKRAGTTVNDVCIILGDAGLNFYQNDIDERRKKMVNELPITTFCIHGNHEIRPRNISTYEEMEFYGGKVLYEPEYPNILFGIDGEIYDFDGMKTIVIGGAYSVDKKFRIARGFGWWEDEQPNEDIKKRVEQNLKTVGNSVDVVLSHTCPAKYIPVEMFLSFIDQRTVDNSTEEWLDKIEDKINYQHWYCGHWHTNKTVDKMHFLYEQFNSLETGGTVGK